jgi:hypothetical protein
MNMINMINMKVIKDIIIKPVDTDINNDNNTIINDITDNINPKSPLLKRTKSQERMVRNESFDNFVKYQIPWII